MQRKWIIFVLRFFDFWGCCTEFAVTKRFDECYSLIFVLHLVLMFITGWLIIVFLKRPTDDTLGHFNDTFKLGSILFVCILSVIESYFKRTKQQKFWHIFQIIQRKFHSNRSFPLNKYVFRLILYTFVSIISTLYFDSYLGVFTFSISFCNIWITYDLVTKVYQNRMWCYLFYLELIQSEWDKIMEIVERAAQTERIETYEINNKRSRTPLKCKRSLKQICEYYQLIRQLSECLNSAFAWSNAVAILFTFGFILTELNCVYWKWYNEYNFTNMLG